MLCVFLATCTSDAVAASVDAAEVAFPVAVVAQGCKHPRRPEGSAAPELPLPAASPGVSKRKSSTALTEQPDRISRRGSCCCCGFVRADFIGAAQVRCTRPTKCFEVYPATSLFILYAVMSPQMRFCPRPVVGTYGISCLYPRCSWQRELSPKTAGEWQMRVTDSRDRLCPMRCF